MKKLLTSLIFILSASYACAYETCLITADGKLTDISIENNDIIDENCLYNHSQGSNCFKKIIATTNTLIITNMSDSNAVRDIDFDIEVPKPSDSFIKKYIEEYKHIKQLYKDKYGNYLYKEKENSYEY